MIDKFAIYAIILIPFDERIKILWPNLIIPIVWNDC
jgi:hypothetical protein